jgi:Mg-chelatase subunit ChlD
MLMPRLTAPARRPAFVKAHLTAALAARVPMLLTALAITLGPSGSLAHDWPTPAVPKPREGVLAQRPSQQAPWPGLLWSGPQAGMPSPPHASHCARPPARFELGDGEPPPQAQPLSRDKREADDLAADGSSEPATRADTARLLARRSAPAETAAAPSALPAPAAAAVAGKAIARQGPPDGPVSAGVVDDNADFGAYREFRARHAQLRQRPWALEERVRLDVRDAAGRPVPDARVEVMSRGVLQPMAARTDAAGRAWLMPQPDVQGRALELRVSRGAAVQTVRWQRGQPDALQVRLDGAAHTRPRLDLVFAIDATGSMADEIAKLKRSMREVAERIAALPQAPDLCFGLVAYRDRGDAFFVRGADLTNDLAAFQQELDALEAGGGGDYPEALAEAVHTAVHRLSWRGEGTARMIVLLADAPPQLRDEGPFVDHEARAALARGIKIVSVGASGLDREGELAMRLLAQASGGRFVFLTYADRHRPASGPGRETVHDVRDYSVETLDKLIVRLVREELAGWPEP